MHIEEGRLVERTCPDCGNIERRAFGESKSERGELASYAIGWTSGHDDQIGHMTIGIGCGNPGGGSFHIEIRIVDDEWGMSLIDTPFESVPQGGPDLTCEQALAHEDLQYIWWVADEVMEQDRRALWMLHWLRGTPAIVSAGVAEDYMTVLRALRDEDGEWQLFDGPEADPATAQLVHLVHALDADRSLLDVLDLEVLEEAERASPGAPWVRQVVT